MVNLNGENSYISLLIYCSKATRYSLQQINSDDEHAQGVFWCGFFFFPPYQQYIACINEFMTYEPIILFPGLYKVKSNEGNAPQQHPIAYTTVRPAWTRRARRRLALTLGFYQSKKYSEKPNFGVWGLAAALPCTSRWLCAIPGVRAGPGLCSPARAQPRAEIT